ncbi:hypothetical protein [Thermodesulfovibrio sp. 3462-1]|uniref:Uncharacterized protein n=1 Tax=Thermodesulfovibrio obliviosus TaxID=3118332 RepID=A0AAU8H2N8_9BACT
MILFVLVIISLLMFCNTTFAGWDAIIQDVHKEQEHIMQEQKEAEKEVERIGKEGLFEKMVKDYLTQPSIDMSYEDKFLAAVEIGRYITAHKICIQKQKNNPDAVKKCAEEIEKARKERKGGCVDLKRVSFLIGVVRAEEARIRSLGKSCIKATSGDEKLIQCKIAQETLKLTNERATFNFFLGTGTVPTEIGDVIFGAPFKVTQIHSFPVSGIVYDIVVNGGVITMLVPTTKYYITIKTMQDVMASPTLMPKDITGEIIDFSMPFNLSEAKTIITPAKGFSMDTKAVIDVMNEMIRNTNIFCYLSFEEILTSEKSRNALVESMIEYLTYPNYLARLEGTAGKAHPFKGKMKSLKH